MNYKLANQIQTLLKSTPKNLTRTQKASFQHSISWKKISHKLLNTNNKKDFIEAVKWCGNNGNVSRTVNNKDFINFANNLFSHVNEILNGNYIVDIDVPKFSRKQPISWTTKICHILSPKKYPIIYDEKNRKALSIKNYDEYIEFIKEMRNEVSMYNDEYIYEIDSNLWASML